MPECQYRLGADARPRCLGIAVHNIVVSQGIRMRVIEAADDRLKDGFHAHEAELDLRWTDGDATIPADIFDGWTGAVAIALRLTGTTSYVADEAASQAA